MRFGLEEKTISKITDVFKKFEQIESVIIYGSRAKGTNREGSDIDLTLIGNNLDLKLLNIISDNLDNLLLPYKFDISIYNYLKNTDIIEHIKRVGINFYTKNY